MAVVPGITNIATDAPDTGGQLGSRAPVQTNLPAPPELQPAAQPTNTYKGYAQFSDPNLQRIADSLGQLAPSIYQYGDIQAQMQRRTQDDEMIAATAGKSPDEITQIVQSDPRFQNRMGQMLGHSLLGQALGEQGPYGASAAVTAYNTQYDKVNGNFDQWSNSWLQQGLSQIDDPVAQAAYARRMQATFASLRGLQTQFSVQQQQTDQQQLMSGGFSATVGQAVDSNLDPQRALQAIRQQMATTNAIYARMTPQQQNMALVDALEKQVDTLKDAPDYDKRYNLIKGILSLPTNQSAIPIQPGKVFATGYSPQAGGDTVEGGYASSQPGPDGSSTVRTLEDVRAGRSPYVTLAGNPSLYGSSYTLPSVTYQANGQTYTLNNVKGVVHDTGSAFQSAPAGRFDIAIGRDLNPAERNQSISGVQFVPGDVTPSNDGHALIDDAVVGGKARDVLMRANALFTDRDQQAHSDEVSKVQQLAEAADPTYFQARDQLIQDHPRWEAAHGLERWDNQFYRASAQKQQQLQKQQADIAEQSTLNTIKVNTGVAALNQGTAHSVTDQYYTVTDPATGKPVIDPQTGQPKAGIYEAKKLIDDAVDTRQDQIDQQFQSDPNGRFQAMVKLYGDNGIVNKQWATTLKAGAAAAGNAAGANGQMPPATTDGLNLYRQLQAQNPQLLAMHTDKASQDFYNVASTAMDGLKMDPTQALQMAQRATSDPNFGKAMPDMEKRQTMQTVKSQLGSWVPWATSLANANNSDEVSAKVVEAADLVHRATGLPIDAAVKQVAPQVAANYQVVNGNAVNVVGREVPQNFGELATRYIGDFAGQNRAFLDSRGIDPSALQIMNVGQTANWVLYYNGRPLPSTVPGSAFSVQQLFQEQQQMNADARAKALHDVQHRNDPWLQIGNPDGPAGITIGPFFGQGMTPAQGQANHAGAVEMYRQQQKQQQQFDSQHEGDPTLGRVIPGL